MQNMLQMQENNLNLCSYNSLNPSPFFMENSNQSDLKPKYRPMINNNEMNLINYENDIENDNNNNNINNEENITHILAEFLTKYVFELVGIDIDGEIPIELLRAKMDERDDKSEYLEFFLCADNFA